MKRLFCAFALFALLIQAAAFAQAGENDLNLFSDELETALQERGASWSAERNRFADMSLDELTKRFGWMPESELREDMPILPTKNLAADEMQEHLDWRDMNGKNYVTPVLEQHPCGSCWATSTLAAVESAIAIKHDLNNPFMRLSIQHLVSECCAAGDCGGGSMAGALEFILNEGVAEEPCFPYRRWNSPCEPCEDWTDWSTTISGYGRIDPVDNPQAIMQALQDGPVIAGIDIYLDWIFYAGGVWEHATGPVVGAHAVLIVGYDQAEQYWIVRNSCGTWWGDHGYILMRWGEADIEGWTARPLYEFDEPVHADFSAESTEGCAGAPVQFENLTTPDADYYYWRFWDRQSSKDINPTHVWDEPGMYTVTLSAWTPEGRSDVRKDDYITIHAAPRADFIAESETACPNEAIAFSNNSEGWNISYQWDFGDDATSTEAEPAHEYQAPGDYAVSLKVTDGCGLQDETTKVVRVINAAVDCDDENVCTDEECYKGACAHRANSESCDDGVFCNGEDYCLEMKCQGHSGNPCPDECESCYEEAETCVSHEFCNDHGADSNSGDNDDDDDDDDKCGGLF